MVHRLTGACPTVAVHTQWDFPNGLADADAVPALAQKHGIAIGAINPNLFEAQDYKFGSFCSPDEAVREKAIQQSLSDIELAKKVGSKMLSMWFADGTNYPGQDDIRTRKAHMVKGLQRMHKKLAKDQVLLVEYKPFEPAFYHTDIGDWGMAYILCKQVGKQAKVLVDTGHHFQSQNIEQIVAWLLDEGMLGGFHFNDRRYADDDLTLGSIDPYQVFRIFHEIHNYAHDTGKLPEIAYMIDQSHNIKNKVEASVQTVVMAQELFAKAAIVDRVALKKAQANKDVVAAELCLKEAFFADITPALTSWRKGKGVAANPLAELRKSKYIEKTAKERAARRAQLGLPLGGPYA